MDIDGFMQEFGLRTRSAESLRTYRSDLEKYEAYLKATGIRVTQADGNTIQGFLKHLSEQSTRKAGDALSPASAARRLSCVSTFYEYLRLKSNGRITNPVRLVRRPKVQNDNYRALDEATVQTLLEGIDNRRDKAIVALFVASGLRIAELISLDKTSITQIEFRLSSGELRKLGTGEVVGKGNRRRSFLIDEHTLTLLVDYVRERGPDNIPALFISNQKRRMCDRNIRDILDRHCKRLGLPHIHPHALRHTFCTRLVGAGCPSLVVQQLMGHKTPAMLTRYTKPRIERLAREYFAACEFIGGPVQTPVGSFGPAKVAAMLNQDQFDQPSADPTCS